MVLTDNSLKRKVFSGMIWRISERGSIQFINFALQIVLARILSTDDYGILAILSAFINISTTLINNGLVNSLIQKKNSDDLDLNTIFWIQFGISIVLVGILFVMAPFVAAYYCNDMITEYLRVMSILLIVESLSTIQLTVLRKRLEFKKSFFANVIGTIVYGIVGISLAINNCGCWSLIWAQIAMKIAVLVVLLFRVRWVPRFAFSFHRFASMFSYSWKLTVGWLLGTLHQNIFSLVIGKCFPTSVLGYYNRAQNLPNTMTVTLNETISNVMFPALSLIQDDARKMKTVTRRMMRVTAFVVCPIMAGIAGISKSFVLVFLKEKWAPSIPLMQIFCIVYGINVISTTNMQTFNAIGRSDVFMKAEIVKRSLSLVVLLLMVRIGILAVVIGLSIMGLYSLCYNAYQNRKVLGYSIAEQGKDILISFVCAVFMFGIVELINWISLAYSVTLVIQIFVGVISYLMLSYLLNKEVLSEVFVIVRSAIHHSK